MSNLKHIDIILKGLYEWDVMEVQSCMHGDGKYWRSEITKARNELQQVLNDLNYIAYDMWEDPIDARNAARYLLGHPLLPKRSSS